MRMIQTNLREIDANLDVKKFINSLEEFSANVVLFNTGGIVANYSTRLLYHYKNPFMKDDLVGNAVKLAKEKKIRFISRFDFSIYRNLLLDHPAINV